MYCRLSMEPMELSTVSVFQHRITVTDSFDWMRLLRHTVVGTSLDKTPRLSWQPFPTAPRHENNRGPQMKSHYWNKRKCTQVYCYSFTWGKNTMHSDIPVLRDPNFRYDWTGLVWKSTWGCDLFFDPCQFHSVPFHFTPRSSLEDSHILMDIVRLIFCGTPWRKTPFLKNM